MRVIPFNQQMQSSDFPGGIHGSGGGGVRCMSLACETKGHCAPTGQTNSFPPRYIYPPDCATGAAGHPYGNDMIGPGGVVADQGTVWTVPADSQGAPIGQDASASSPAPFNIAEMLSGMSTTTLLLLGGAAYFLFFRKGR